MKDFNQDNQITLNFNSKEFDSPDIRYSGNNINNELVLKLQAIRTLYKAPIKVNSGVRSKFNNVSVGGVGNSEHLTGDAVDIHCNTSLMRYELLSLAMMVGFTRIGIGRNFLHLGVGTGRIKDICWLY